MTNILFLTGMLLAAVLNFARLGLAAALLAPADFGIYTSIIGVVALSGMAVSFGLMETTTKLYPRLWVSGQLDEIRRDARARVLKMGLRVLALTVCLALLVETTGLSGTLGIGGGVALLLGVLVWISTLLNLCTALIRATGAMGLLQAFAFVRSSIPLVLVAIALSGDAWLPVILAETIGLGVVALMGLMLVRRTMRRHVVLSGAVPAEAGSDAPAAPGERDGRVLYFANIMSSSILLGDRALITALLGPVIGGAYGAVALITQSGNLLSGILSQKFGPEIIRRIHKGAAPRQGLGLLGFPALALGLAALGVALVTSFGPVLFPPLASFLEARGIGSSALLAAALLVFLQIFLPLEFLIIALDRERAILRASALALLVWIGSVTLCYRMELGLTAYILSIAAARIIQMTALILAIGHDIRREAYPASQPPR
ncbi:MAG: hypothetical protein AB8B85_01120 [Paracoccaceae bacterium]